MDCRPCCAVGANAVVGAGRRVRAGRRGASGGRAVAEGAARAAQVVGGLLDAEAPDEFINNLILSVRSLIPVEQLCAEVPRPLSPLRSECRPASRAMAAHAGSRAAVPQSGRGRAGARPGYARRTGRTRGPE